MLRKINYINISRVILGLAVLSIGFAILANPKILIQTVTTLLGISFALEGISYILESTYPKNKSPYALADLSLGCIFLAFGTIIAIDTEITLFLLGIFLLLLVFLSFLHQGMVCYERLLGGLKYGIAAGFGIIHLIFAGLIIYSLASEGILFTSFIGIYLLILGVMMITSLVYQRPPWEET